MQAEQMTFMINQSIVDIERKLEKECIPMLSNNEIIQMSDFEKSKAIFFCINSIYKKGLGRTLDSIMKGTEKLRTVLSRDNLVTLKTYITEVYSKSINEQYDHWYKKLAEGWAMEAHSNHIEKDIHEIMDNMRIMIDNHLYAEDYSKLNKENVDLKVKNRLVFIIVIGGTLLTLIGLAISRYAYYQTFIH